MESITAKKIREHLDKRNLINHSQHGFTEGKSCLKNLLSFPSKVYEAIDNCESYDIQYLNCNEAFDKVSVALKRQVRALGIDEKILG